MTTPDADLTTYSGYLAHEARDNIVLNIARPAIAPSVWRGLPLALLLSAALWAGLFGLGYLIAAIRFG